MAALVFQLSACHLFTLCAAGSSAAAGPDEAVCAAKVGRMKLLNGVALHIAHHKSQNKPLYTPHAAHNVVKRQKHPVIAA